MAILFGLGHSATTLVPFSPQPAFVGILYSRAVYAPAAVYEDAPYVELDFKALTPREMDLLMQALDLKVNSSRAITLSIPGYDRKNNTKYNGYAVRPVASYTNPLHYDVMVTVRSLRETT